MLRMIDLMINGSPSDPSGTAYTIYDAARFVGYTRHAARALKKSPAFIVAFNNAVDDWQRNRPRPTFDDIIPLSLDGVAPRPKPITPGFVIRTRRPDQ
ncbi:MAG: hypothetical protein WDN46_14710 [Methylocella sp.]